MRKWQLTLGDNFSRNLQIYYSAPKSQLAWLKMSHLDHVIVDKDFRTLCSEYVVRSIRSSVRKTKEEKTLNYFSKFLPITVVSAPVHVACRHPGH